MQNTNLLLRNDTVLGVCEAIGQDFGFNPTRLRVAFAALFYLSPIAVVVGYLALGVVVAASRWIAPNAQVDAPHLVSSHELAQAKLEAEALPIAA